MILGEKLVRFLWKSIETITTQSNLNFKENQCFEEKEYFGFKLHVDGCHLSALHHYACRTQFPNHYVAPAVVTERARPDMFIVNLKDASHFLCWQKKEKSFFVGLVRTLCRIPLDI